MLLQLSLERMAKKGTGKAHEDTAILRIDTQAEWERSNVWSILLSASRGSLAINNIE
jgi:hypothetical protein